MRERFHVNDMDGDNFIDAEEFRAMYKNSPARELADNIMIRMDTDGDGKVSFGEYFSMYFIRS